MVGAQSASRLPFFTAIYSLLYYYGLCQAVGQCGRAKKASEQRKSAPFLPSPQAAFRPFFSIHSPHSGPGTAYNIMSLISLLHYAQSRFYSSAE